MFKKLCDRKGQNTAEYAILIALVVGAVIAMQTYVQRAMNGRVLDTTKFMSTATNSVTGSALQYEPYYQNTSYDTARTSGEMIAERGISLNKQADTLSNKTGQEQTVFDRTGVTDYGN